VNFSSPPDALNSSKLPCNLRVVLTAFLAISFSLGYTITVLVVFSGIVTFLTSGMVTFSTTIGRVTFSTTLA